MKKKSFFSHLWPKINTKDDAIEATKNSQFLAFYLALAYGVNLLFVLFTGEDIFEGPFIDSFEKNFFIIVYILIIAFFIWLGFRIRDKKFGLVPYLCGWCLIEMILKLVVYPGQGVIVALIVAVYSISCLRAWWSLRSNFNSKNQ